MTLRETVAAVLEEHSSGITEEKLAEIIGPLGWSPDLDHGELAEAIHNSVMALHLDGTVVVVLNTTKIGPRCAWKLAKFKKYRSIDAEWDF